MREFSIRRALGEKGLEIEVNVTKIQYECREFTAKNRRNRVSRAGFVPKMVKPVLYKMINAVARFDLKESEVRRHALVQTPTYLTMKDVFDHRENLRASRTYETIARTLEHEGVFLHKQYAVKDKQSIEDCIRACYLDILLSMEKSGYRADKKSSFASAGMGTAFIDKDGSILKALKASHRLAAAQIVGMQTAFPLRVIGAHEDWLAAHQIGSGSVNDMKTLALQIRRVAHENS